MSYAQHGLLSSRSSWDDHSNRPSEKASSADTSPLPREAWDLLLSEPSQKSYNPNAGRASATVTSLASSVSKTDVCMDADNTISPFRSRPSTPSGPSAPLAPSAARFPSRLTRLANGTGSGRAPVQDDDRDEGKPRTNFEQSSNSQSVPEEAVSGHEDNVDVTRLLQNLRNDLNTLESSSSAPDEQNTRAINLLNRKLERLTEAVLPTTSPSAAPAKDGKSSNIDGHPSSASPDSDQDLCCWEPCCGGRKFSNKSNIVRHQRERSGELGKFRCSFCNACFSRSSPRNAHEAKRLCGV